MDRSLRLLRRVFCLALAAAGMLWGALMIRNPQGVAARVFYVEGREFLGDFVLTRTCAEYGYANERQASLDACYPPLGPTSTLPFPLTRSGGLWFMGLGLAFWSVGFCFLLRRVRDAECDSTGPQYAGERILLPFALFLGCLLSSCMLHAFERGNPILHTAAAVMFFVAGQSAQSRWMRWGAAVALAVAAALKITPAALAFVYMARWIQTDDRDVRHAVACDFGVFVGASLVLFVLPFAWYGGWEGFLQWLSNAMANAREHAHRGAWGLVPIGRTMRILLHVDVSQSWQNLWVERGLNVCLGLVCLAGAVRLAVKRVAAEADLLLLLVATMLLVPGNMHFYTGLYLLPVMVLRLWKGMTALEAVCWFAILCPLQVPLGAGCLNHPIANVAFLFLAAQALVRSWCAGRCA